MKEFSEGGFKEIQKSLKVVSEGSRASLKKERKERHKVKEEDVEKIKSS